jgi:plasmid segregation protein ParM
VGLLDIGGHTVNVATFTELREIARQTASIDAGTWGPLAEIGKRINAAYPGQELRGHAVVEAVKRGTIRHYGEERDISGIARDVLRPFARRILAEASQVWGSAAQLDALLIAGGGAEVVGPTLATEYPHARVVANPQWANVEGYLKFGRRRLGE